MECKKRYLFLLISGMYNIYKAEIEYYKFGNFREDFILQIAFAVPRGCLQFVIVVFPDHTHLLFLKDIFTTVEICDLPTVHDLPTSVSDRVLSLFQEGFYENKAPQKFLN